MSRSLCFILLTLPLLLMSYKMRGGQITSISRTSATSLHASTSRSLLDDPATSISDSTFSFEKLPNPLQANSQKVALKLVAISRKVRHLVKVLSQEEFTRITGLTTEKMEKILSKSEQIEQKLIEVNLRLVHSIALQHQGMGLELEDLVYEGVRGLKKALSKFDPEKGFAFSTYAYPWIREYIRSALASALPIALPRHVYRLLMRVKALQQQMQMSSSGRAPTDEETAEEMGIPFERFEVVRRAMALAAHSNDATPAVSLGGSSNSRVQFHEATWERVVEDHTTGSVLEHVESNQAQPDAHTERSMSEIRGAVLRALNTLPEEESRAIHERLGLGSYATTDRGSDRGTSMLKFSEMSEGADKEAAKSLYQKGVRRLRRRALDPKYPEMKALQRIFNELQQSSGGVLQEA